MTRFVLVSLVSLLVIGGVIAAGELFAWRQFGLESDSSIRSAVRIGLLAGSTYIGIISQVLTGRLKRLREKRVSITRELRRATEVSDFWVAIIASPLVIAAAYSAITDVRSLILTCSIGFQNGFFFHSILAKHDMEESK